MNALATTNSNRVATGADQYADALPPWLQYLVAAFPTSKLAARTFVVMEDAFREEPPAILQAAARRATEEKNYFPTVYEMKHYVRKEHEKGEGEQWRLPPIEYYRRMTAMWPVCPDCGEKVKPGWDSCPACADMARMTR